MIDTRPRAVQAQRARTDFEFAVGDDMWALLSRDDVIDVNIRPNGKVVFIGKKGREVHSSLRYDPISSEEMARAILQCLNPVPELNDENQAVDCKMMLSDGEHFARVHIDAPPATGPGFQICIRKQTIRGGTFEEHWVRPGIMLPEAFDVFRWTILARRNVVFCGKMVSGKTFARNCHFELMKRLDPTRAVVEIMDVDETVCPLDDFTPLYITKHRSAADHCRSFVRMSAESVGVNELRGAEAYDLIHNLWISGHVGSSTTLHAETPEEAIWRVKTLVAESGKNPDPEVIAKAMHVMVFLRYSPTIGRRMTQIVHVKGVRSDGSINVENLVAPQPWPADADAVEYHRSNA